MKINNQIKKNYNKYIFSKNKLKVANLIFLNKNNNKLNNKIINNNIKKILN